jgi:hypothetical protein
LRKNRNIYKSCDRKYKSKIEENRKVCAAINRFETVFSKNVVCRYFLFFYASKHAKKRLLLRFLCNFKCNHARLHFQNPILESVLATQQSFHRTLPKKKSSAAIRSSFKRTLYSTTPDDDRESPNIENTANEPNDVHTSARKSLVDIKNKPKTMAEPSKTGSKTTKIQSVEIPAAETADVRANSKNVKRKRIKPISDSDDDENELVLELEQPHTSVAARKSPKKQRRTSITNTNKGKGEQTTGSDQENEIILEPTKAPKSKANIATKSTKEKAKKIKKIGRPKKKVKRQLTADKGNFVILKI